MKKTFLTTNQLLSNRKRITDLEGKILKPDVNELYEFMKINKCQTCNIKCEKCQLDCGDKICESCLNKLNKFKCPYCKKELSGGKITEKIYNNIMKNERQAKLELVEISDYILKILELNSSYNLKSLEGKSIDMYKLAYYNLGGE